MEENEEQIAAPDLTETSADDDLRAALGDGRAPWESDDPVEDAAPDPSVSTPVGDTQSPPNEDAAPSPEEISKVLGHPDVQARLRTEFQKVAGSEAQRAAATERARLEYEAQVRKAQEDDLLLDDEEYGRRMRDQQKQAPVLQQAHQAGYTKAQADFFQLGVGSIWQTVPELKELDAAKKNELDPMNPKFRTYGDYINAVVDVAAGSRATKLAQAMAQDIAKAQTASELTKLRKSAPGYRAPAGPASAPGPIIDLDKMTGDELLKKAFA